MKRKYSLYLLLALISQFGVSCTSDPCVRSSYSEYTVSIGDPGTYALGAIGGDIYIYDEKMNEIGHDTPGFLGGLLIYLECNSNDIYYIKMTGNHKISVHGTGLNGHGELPENIYNDARVLNIGAGHLESTNTQWYLLSIP